MGVVSFATFSKTRARQLIDLRVNSDPHARFHGSVDWTSIEVALRNLDGTCSNRSPRLQISSRPPIR